MTTREIRKKISDSGKSEWAQNIRFTVNDVTAQQIDIYGVTSIYEFTLSQIEGWRTFQQLPNFFSFNLGRLVNLMDQLVGSIINDLSSDETRLNSQWNNIYSAFTQHLHHHPFFKYDSDVTEFLLEIHRESPQYFGGASAMVTNQYKIQNLGERDFYQGAQLASEFILKGKKAIAVSSEIRSLINYKADIAKYLTNNEKEINELHTRAKRDYEEIIQQLKLEREQKEHLFNDWFKTVDADHTAFKSKSNSDIGEIKKTYQELLRLQEPAQYWKHRAEKLKREGRIAAVFLISLIIVGMMALYFLLWQTPEGMLSSFFNNDKTAAIRWSIIFITFMSLVFLGIRYSAKLMFSSFHLSRDAEERYQLTHVYLALIKEATIDEKERHLIMQSLISRADTGLLKDEAGPTMPNGVDGILNSKGIR